MEIIKITPQGFCRGVLRAIAIINKALKKENIKKPLYMLGGLVHNKHIIHAYQEKGIIIIDSIDNIYEGTIIITAHGISEAVLKKIRDHKLGIINATCFDVLKTHKIIKDKINEGFDVVFYGKKNHPETKGILGIDQKIHLIESSNDLIDLNIDNKNIIFATQTTMSYLDVLEIIAATKLTFPNIQTFDEVCSATKLRQNALIETAKISDLCIVVGDPSSNNTNKLKEVCEKYTNTPCIMVETIIDLQDYDFSEIKKLAITAGASTPPAIVDEIITGIKTNNFNSKLTSDDYIKF